MSERLLSVGLDVGTTSTQLVVSELTIENRASSFAVPDLEIARRKLLYKSPVHFTPLLGEALVDGSGIRAIVEAEYRKAGITRADVDTGAIIVTGETSRRENARAVLDALADLAGDFVVATAGPDLESVLAAKGSGAVEQSQKTGRAILHMDIGGGTSNLALIREGKILRTGCLNVGGRLVKFREDGSISYLSPVLPGISPWKVGNTPTEAQKEELAQVLVQALEMAAGLREPTPLLERFLTKEAQNLWQPPKEPVLLSFSGGVADCITTDRPPFAFGDLGPVLGKAIRHSRLCQGEYLLSPEAIRATVIGAGCHSAQLSGSTVFHQNVQFPLKNMPVVNISEISQAASALARQEEQAVLAIPGVSSPRYREIAAMAQALAEQIRGPVFLCLEQDMAKALGQALALRLPPGTPVLCIDRIRVREGSYLDIGAPLTHALPVVVKTLIIRG